MSMDSLEKEIARLRKELAEKDEKIRILSRAHRVINDSALIGKGIDRIDFGNFAWMKDCESRN